MKDNNFEKTIKATYDAHDPVLDTDAIWDNIEPELKKKKKRRFLFLWFLFGGLLLGGITYGVLNSEQTEMYSDLAQLQSGDSASSVTEQSNMGIDVLSGNLTDVNTPDSVQETDDEDSKSFSSLTSKNKTTQEHEKNSLQSKGVNRPIDNTSSPQLITSSNSDLKDLYTETLSEDKSTTKEDQPSVIEELRIDEKIFVQEAETEKEAMKNEQEPLAESAINVKDEEVASKPKKEKSEEEKKKKKKKLIRRFKRQKWQYQMQVTTAPTVALKRLTNREGFGQVGLVVDRKKTEKQQIGFSVNYNLQMQHKKGFLLFLGLEYQQLSERFEFTRTTIDEVIKEGTVTVTENIAGDIISSTSGDKLVKTTRIEKKSIQNQYRFFNMPIGIGVAWNNRKNGYKFYGGIDYNIAYRFSGGILSQPNVPIKLNKRDPFYSKVFKNKTSAGLWVAMEYNRPINARLNGVVATRGQVPLSSLTSDDYQLLQQYYRLSIDVGINYLLNPNKKKKKRGGR